MATSRVTGLVAVALLTSVVAASGQQVSASKNRDRNVITTEEVESAQVNNAYQVIERIRPEFLRRMTRHQTLGAGATGRLSGSRGQSGGAGMSGGGDVPTPGGTDPGYSQPAPAQTAAVFVDGTQMGGLDELQQVASNMIEEIRFLSGTDAQTKYGPRFSDGVIEVKLKNH
ncbi:MAG TPA: hypothetical protein VIE46_06070 [Gemmatimonadales bacterium]